MGEESKNQNEAAEKLNDRHNRSPKPWRFESHRLKSFSRAFQIFQFWPAVRNHYKAQSNPQNKQSPIAKNEQKLYHVSYYNMKILAIETSCDETAIAFVEAKGGLKNLQFKIIKNEISSQIEIHRPYGGVFPALAKREHLKNLPLVFKKISARPEILKPDIIAVTVGPGLEPCLWTGINFAKEIQKKYFTKVKIIGVNHLEGHLYSFLLQQKTGISKSEFLISKLFPAVALIVSGGHTILLLMKSLTEWKKLGETLDDAVGESFDKVARMLGLPYPGGPEIEKLAKFGNPNVINFPRPMLNQKNYNFSFSGLKTSVLYYLRDHPKTSKSDIATSFQKAAIDVLVAKTMRAAKEFNAKSIMLSGGVAANKELRKELKAISHKLKTGFLTPPQKFNTDNAAMIAAAAYLNYLQNKNYRLIANSNLNL